MAKNYPFLSFFPNHVYRYIDQTGAGRPALSCADINSEMNMSGYESYFSVNGFANFRTEMKAKRENCTNLNAFFIDIDGRKDLEELEAIKKKLDPTFILETGNGHHIYWLLDEPIYREDMTPEEWEDTMQKWERIEDTIVSTLNADPPVKDVPRILRIPATYYWKKSGDAYKAGTKGVFQIKGIYKEPAHTYTMDAVAEAFPPKEKEIQKVKDLKRKDEAEAERNDFFAKVNASFPITERDSFMKLVSGAEGTIPANAGRNQALIITASLAKQAGWTKEMMIEQINKVGWHGIERESGGAQEILSTINSAYQNNYTYTYHNEVIAHNMTGEETMRMKEAFLGVFKLRKEKDKVRFSNYEHEIFLRNPNFKKTSDRSVYNYVDGVYKRMTDMEVEKIFYNALDYDMLWNYKTAKNVSDKMKALLAIIPDLKLTDSKGLIINLKNGLLNIKTYEITAHTPDFVSLIQSPVSYDRDATCPVWESCVKAWMDGDESEKKTELLQQYAGYAITPSMQHDRALFLIGDGGNGKSTFVDTIAMVIGDKSVAHIDLQDLYGTFGMEGLIGKRLNVIEEVHGNYYQSDKLKKLISGEPVTINIKHKSQLSFKPECKFMFAVNIMPRVDDSSVAMERRICAVVFKNNFRGIENTKLRNANGVLAQELSGILNWMLIGANKLNDSGKFIVTNEQLDLLGEYRQENSSVEGYIGECLTFEEGATMLSRELYDSYKEFCARDGRKFKSLTGFTKEMKAHGKRFSRFTFHERTNGKTQAYFEGIAISEDWLRSANTHVSTYLNSR